MGNRTPGRGRQQHQHPPSTSTSPPPPLPPLPAPQHHFNLNNAIDPYFAAIQASIAESPLPLGWEESITSKGVVYYIDHLNGVTTFQDPRLTTAIIALRKRRKRKETSTTTATAVKEEEEEEELPKYKRDLYSKSQCFLVRLHQRQQQDEGQLQITVDRQNILVNSFQFISNLDSLTLTRRLFIKYELEEGLDYGGMSREWFLSLSDQILNPEFHLFRRCPSGYYQIHRFSHLNKEHLEYFRFVGTIMGMAVYHGKNFQSSFGLPFYKELLDRPVDVSDLQYEDPILYGNIKKLQDAEDIDDWELDFTITDKDESGKPTLIYLKDEPSLLITNQNKKEYLDLVLKYYFQSTHQQMMVLKEAFYQFAPFDLLKEFEPEEIEQILVGTHDIDLNDLKLNTTYGEGYQESDSVIKLFWEVMFSLTQEQLRNFLQFTTGSNKIPVGGFSRLFGSKGPQKFTVIPKKTVGLPTAHSCFNRLELPQYYTDKEKLKKDLLFAITETQGFGLE